MAEIGLPQPQANVGIKGNSQDLNVLKSHEKLAAPTSVPNYGDALNELASAPTTLGIVGAQLMNSSSIAMATKMGQSLGKEPHGNLIPGITNFDKNVAAAYTAESQTILGNQANALVYNAQEQMAKVDKLTPDIISSYKNNVAKGLQDTLELAPDSLKPQLENQFLHQVNSTTHELNLKLTAQNKAQADSSAAVWRTHQNDFVTNQVKDAKTPKDFEAAKQSFESLKQNITNSNLSPAKKDTALTTAKTNYDSALSINKLLDARANGKEDQYLASMTGKKIPGLTWSESEQVTANTVRYLGAIEATENRDQNLTMSEANLDMAQGSFNESKLADLRDKLREENYNKVASQWAKQQRVQHVENQALQGIISNPGNASSYDGLTPKQINAGFDLLKSAVVQQNPGIPEEEASFRTASAMNTIVPKYIDHINRELANGNPAQVLGGLEAYERTHELDGNKVIGINDKALITGEIFKNMLANQNVDPDLALQKAREIVYNKDENIIKNNNAIIHANMMKYAGTPANRTSYAIKLSGLGTGIPVDNKAAFEADMFSRYSGYMQLSNGDSASSEAQLKKDAAKIWGETRVNGKTQITRLGVEQAISYPSNAAPLIQEDVINQLGPQLQATKELYDKGGSPHYWRIKEGRTNYQEYAKAKLSVREHGYSDPKYSVHQQLIKKFEAGTPIEIEQVTKNGSVTWNLDVQSSPYAQRSPTTQKVSGYNIGIVHPETGEKGQLYGFYGNTHNIPTYSPNEDWIKKNYVGINNLSGLSPEDYVREGNKPFEKPGVFGYRHSVL